jgi:hypothetical protein
MEALMTHNPMGPYGLLADSFTFFYLFTERNTFHSEQLCCWLTFQPAILHSLYAECKIKFGLGIGLVAITNEPSELSM